MDKNRQPGITLDSILIAELHFKRSPALGEKLDYDIEVNTQASFNKEKNVLSELLVVNVKSKDGVSIATSCTVHGQFSAVYGEENLSLEDFSKENAPAILYPFCREAIATVSMKAGMPPILLPPFNFHAAQKSIQEPNPS